MPGLHIVTPIHKLITLQMWDTAVQERFKWATRSTARGADAAILVYECRTNFLRLASEKADEFPTLLLGNKHDLADKSAVSADQAGIARVRLQFQQHDEASIALLVMTLINAGFRRVARVRTGTSVAGPIALTTPILAKTAQQPIWARARRRWRGSATRTSC